jgi:ABC-type branched-subunit amino acid transport system substrate-binding protein
MVCRSFLLLAGILALAACTEGEPSPPPIQYYVPGNITAGSTAPITPPPPAGGNPAIPAPAAPGTPPPAGPHVALLAPVTGANAERGQALVQAAQLALSAPGSPVLDVRDTLSTPEGAAAAAKAAIAGGDQLILGPLTAAETAAVAPIARPAGIAVLAFTNDPAQAQPGVWTLGITPVQQVRRMVGAVMAQGKTRFAAMLPPGEFGSAMGSALTQVLATAGAPPPVIQVNDGTDHNISETLRDLSGYAERRAPIEAKIRAAKALHTAAGRKEAAELARQGVAPAPFDALLLADTGGKLAWASSFLGYYDISPSEVRILGPSLWSVPAMRAGADLNGAWYAAPDPAARTAFEQDFQAKYSAAAPGIADFAYDAAAIARVQAQAPGGFTAAALCRPDGFAGVDGVLALQPDGTVRRGLAVFEIQPSGPVIIDPAPTTLASPGI